MHLPTLTALIADLTHSADRLERALAFELQPPRGDDRTVDCFTEEIATLHTTIDGLNALYEAEDDRQKDARFEDGLR